MTPQGALIPIVVLILAIAFDVYCLRELARADVVLGFPAEFWAVVIFLLTPFGGIAYLKPGRPH
jgi:hypothetical protein